jgi:outer membrane protein insertion porin family
MNLRAAKIFLLFSLCIYACSNVKYLPASEKLYTGAKVEIAVKGEKTKEKTIIKLAENVIRPEPNSKILGMRVKLWLYNIAGKPKGKGLRYWLKNKVGEPPVLFSEVKPSQAASFIDAALFNRGIFRSLTEYKIIEKEKTASVVYTLAIHDPYKIDSVFWPQDDDELSATIRKAEPLTLLKRKDDYNLEILTRERIRIDEDLKNNGFFYFNHEYIEFGVDTTHRNKTVNIHIRLKDETPYEALLVYHINEVYVKPDYSLRRDSVRVQKDTVVVDDVHYIAADKSYRPKTLIRAIFVRKDETYSRYRHNMTLNRLMGIGAFKFVNVRFRDADSLHPGYLDAFINLTPLPRKSIRAEIELMSKSNNFAGPSLNLSYHNRNALNGAELLIVNAHGSFETQFYGTYKGLFSFEFGPQIDLYVPRFITPFNIKNRSGFYIPKTRFTAGYDFVRRVQYFDLNSFKFIFGYKWKESSAKEHELNPVNISYSTVSRTSDEFNALLERNPLLKKSFDEQFIAGLTYSYVYNQQVYDKKRNQIYFNPKIETSGNSIYLISKTFFKKSPTPDDPLRVFDAVFSQFLRIEIDFRNFYNLTRRTRLAGRLYAGSGWSYGNSSTLPYIKQFFSGGANSIRAFRARSLGPGQFYSTEISNTNYFEQGGEMKLEINGEYRFPIISLLKGAIFVDAGNIWLIENNPAVPGGQFHTSTFIKELAVGTGFGFRFDANFFVLRLDFAFPVRKPWLAPTERWVYSDIDFGSPGWRSDNLVLNIAIGYPF